MCGIAGILCPQGWAENDGLVQSLLRLLEHRGPDDHGWLLSSPREFQLCRGLVPHREAEVILLHRRLSILDLSEAGWQPMGTPDGRFFLVFNGEIYNYVELRKELEFLGHVFRSHGDTEVLLHAFAEWGPACLRRLVGMFAFALLDRQARKMILARDFFGIKPLYFTQQGRHFAFASEVKALLKLHGVSRQVQPHRLYEYLTTGITDHGSDTLFADIHQLPAAHYLELSLDRVENAEPVRYWQLPLHDKLDISYEEATARLRELFLENVRLHLRSDVPVGAALSGGIDSSAIVAAMRCLEPPLDLHTFSYLADDPALSEEKWVDIAAARAGAVQHKVKPIPGELVDDLDDLVYQQDEPFGSTSMYAQHRVFRLARETGVTVMLDGQGADEMLGGYHIFLGARLASLVKQGHWLQAARFLHKAGRLPSRNRLRLLLQAGGWLVPAGCKRQVKQFLQKSVMPVWLDANWFEHKGVDPLAGTGSHGRDVLRAQLHESLFQTSLPMLLRYEDRNSMAHSIESRVPFLTPALAEFLLRLPEDYIISKNGTSKRIFRAAMRGLVPDAILERKDKIGFATPEQRWLGHLRPWIEQTLQSDTAKAIPALHFPAIHEEWHNVLRGRKTFDFRVWRWVNLIRWAERFDVKFVY